MNIKPFLFNEKIVKPKVKKVLSVSEKRVQQKQIKAGAMIGLASLAAVSMATISRFSERTPDIYNKAVIENNTNIPKKYDGIPENPYASEYVSAYNKVKEVTAQLESDKKQLEDINNKLIKNKTEYYYQQKKVLEDFIKIDEKNLKECQDYFAETRNIYAQKVFPALHNVLE